MPEKEIKNGEVEVEAYYKSFKILLAMPFENGAAIMGLINKMSEMGFTPERVIYQAEKTPDKEKPPPVCPIHNIEMRKYSKGTNFWWSHRVDGGWCSGKEK